MAEVEAYVSDNGEGSKVVLEVPPGLPLAFTISVDDARVLIAKLTRATNAAAKNGRVDSAEMPF